MRLERVTVTIHVVAVCRAGHVHQQPDARLRVLVLHPDTRGAQVLRPVLLEQLLTAQPSVN